MAINHLLMTLLLPLLFLRLPLVTARTIPLIPRHAGATNPLTHLTLPLSSLPPPASNFNLYVVALGLGTQNYSCVDAASSDAPTAVGALASLYDISAILEDALIGQTMEMALPGLALGVWGKLGGAEGQKKKHKKSGGKEKEKQKRSSEEEGEKEQDSAWSHVVSNLPLHSSSSSGGGDDSPSTSIHVPQLMGHHFFSSTGVPSWSFLLSHLPASSSNSKTKTSDTVLFQGAKAASVAAPADASKGFSGEAAVPWLYLKPTPEELKDVDAAGTAGIEAVYRVVTAGGSAPETCQGWVGEKREYAYAAEYWVYGR